MRRSVVLALAVPLLVFLSLAVRQPRRVARRPVAGIVFVGQRFAQVTFGRRLQTLLKGDAFDRLESIADSLARHDVRTPDGISMLLVFYEQGFRTVNDDRSPELWEEHLARLRQWCEARPYSPVARCALAEGLYGRGHTARGNGWAKNVSPSQWRRYASDLDEAAHILEQVPAADRDLEWHSAMMRTLWGLGEGERYRALAAEAFARFREPRLYLSMGTFLLPRWHGEPGDWQAFAERPPALPDSLRDEYYARIVLTVADVCTDLVAEEGPVDWPRARRGLDDWQRRWPASTEPRQGRALLAWMVDDRAVGRASFAALGDSCDIEVWATPGRFQAGRAWVAGAPN